MKRLVLLAMAFTAICCATPILTPGAESALNTGPRAGAAPDGLAALLAEWDWAGMNPDRDFERGFQKDAYEVFPGAMLKTSTIVAAGALAFLSLLALAYSSIDFGDLLEQHDPLDG